MIVVIGAVRALGTVAEARPDGLAAAIAIAAAGAGSRVELVARIGDDPPGDAVLIALAQAAVGHVAVLRDAARSTPVRPVEDGRSDLDDEDHAADASGAVDASEPAPTLDREDISLALRYLVDFRVLVAVHPPDAGVLEEVTAAAGYAGAHLVVVADPAAALPGEVPPDALVVTATDDAEGVGEVLGRYAAAVDSGQEPAAAFAATAPPDRAEPVEP